LWSPIAALALNSLNNASTGVSPFFLDQDIPEDLQARRRGRQANNPKKQAEAIVLKLKNALDLANSSMALAQQQQEEAANRRRDPAVHYKMGYQRPTWAWREDIEDTIALDEWETNNPPG
jgi:hypothetical protein